MSSRHRIVSSLCVIALCLCAAYGDEPPIAVPDRDAAVPAVRPTEQEIRAIEISRGGGTERRVDERIVAGRESVAARDYAVAVEAFTHALRLLEAESRSNARTKRKQELVKKLLAETYEEWADGLVWDASYGADPDDFERAKANYLKALDLAPERREAIMAKLRDVEGLAKVAAIKAELQPDIVDPELGNREERIHISLERGKVFAKHGQLMRAREQFEYVLTMHPGHAEAIAHLESLNERLFAEAKRRREEMIRDHVTSGDWEWLPQMPPVPPTADMWAMPATRPAQELSAEAKTRHKLSHLTLPRLHVEETPLPKVISLLAERTRELDSEGIGLNFVVLSGVEGMTVNLDAESITVEDVLKQITRDAPAPLAYRVDPHAVVLYPAVPPSRSQDNTALFAAPDAVAAAGDITTEAAIAIMQKEGVRIPPNAAIHYDAKLRTFLITAPGRDRQAFRRSLDAVQVKLRDDWRWDQALVAQIDTHIRPGPLGRVQTPVTEKIDTLVIPKITFEDAHVSEIFDHLHTRSVELDTEGEGVYFLLILPRPVPVETLSASSSAGNFGEEDFLSEDPIILEPKALEDWHDEPYGPQLSLQLRDVSMWTVLDYVLEAGDLNARYDEYATIIYSGDGMRDCGAVSFYALGENMLRWRAEHSSDDSFLADFQTHLNKLGWDSYFGFGITLLDGKLVVTDLDAQRRKIRDILVAYEAGEESAMWADVGSAERAERLAELRRDLVEGRGYRSLFHLERVLLSRPEVPDAAAWQLERARLALRAGYVPQAKLILAGIVGTWPTTSAAARAERRLQELKGWHVAIEIPVSPWERAAAAPRSRVPFAVPRDSWDLVSAHIRNGGVPTANDVRIEQFVNAFDYHYPAQKDADFAIHPLATRSPFRPDKVLLRVGVQAASRDKAFARDASIHVTFNPARVSRYRLIGYDDRPIASAEAYAQVEQPRWTSVPSGAASTVYYELELLPDTTERDGDLATVAVRYRGERDEHHEITQALGADLVRPHAIAAQPYFYLGAAVAEFAEVLRGSEHLAVHDLVRVDAILADVAKALPDDASVADLRAVIEAARSHLPSTR